MNVFDVHKKIVADYERYIRSFITIADDKIKATVDEELAKGKLWPEPLLQFNPAFKMAGAVADLAKSGVVHKDVSHIFTGYTFYQHQLDAIRLGAAGKDFVVTSGTGSGKSLTYIGTIFSHLLSNPSAQGVTAVVVYPMNALINSQTEEFGKYRANYMKSTGQDFPITFGQYTGQEDEEKREAMRKNPPQILLTNYMMLELLLTRIQERRIRDAIYENLRFLIFDELHTYRGRQGADIAMLIRRIRMQCKHDINCIGTSATMVSGGTVEDQRKQVAQVATVLFGKPFSPDQVVNETLDRSLKYADTLPSREALSKAIRTPIKSTDSADLLRAHPVAVWLENCAALAKKGTDLVRCKPRPVGEIALSLAEDSGESEPECRRCIAELLLWISTVNQQLQHRQDRYSILPFRLHQFFSQTGSVYTTLDQDENRFITLEPGIYKADDDKNKPIFPNVFSRVSGHAFICVTRNGSKLQPREFLDDSEEDEEDESEDGYLIIGDDIWDPDEDMDLLPDGWFRTNKSGRTPTKERAPFLPRIIHFDEYGHCSDTDSMKFTGWFMRKKLLFDPTAGSFFDPKTREATKLAKLGSEGRSTSTTITAFSILAQLREAGYRLGDQKLLSFTDNRQDAALQAGHFNDFVQVVHLRAGIYQALKNSPSHTLDYAQLGEAVFKALALPFTDFATLDKPPSLAPVQRKYEESFQTFLFYRALADLRRSWRIILPNLEQCALLAIDYKDLDEIAATDAHWADLPIVCNLSHAKRREFLATILDFFRLEYAIHSANFLDPSRMKENEKRFREDLRPPWTLDSKEDLRPPSVVRLDRLSSRAHLISQSMGPASSLGKFIKQFVKRENLDPAQVRGDLYRSFILSLMEKLRDADYLHEQPAPNPDGVQMPVYRLKVDKVLWKLGDGTTVKTDVIKRRSFRDLPLRPNEFFRDMYSTQFASTKRLRAEDHTGQLDSDSRIEREDRFRCDWWLDEKKTIPDDAKIRSESISALFCSPTMELGVDIGGLGVVHMRNAPPNPSNYAQRSGRAGRSGQGALVFTYCSSFSPHDRHYFQNQSELVAGAVQPPRLDLCNRELLVTHLNALVISEIGLPGLEVQVGRPASLTALLDMNATALPLSAATRAALEIAPTTFKLIRATFTRIIKDFQETLETNGAGWYSATWIEQNISDIMDHLDAAMKRWRKLHASARVILSNASQRIESGTLAASSDEYKQLERSQKQATRQLNLLTNDLGKFSTELSEFYPYRYLASEGFLPGYNFTRLPIRIYIPTSATTGEFISRSRAVALREFGPRNIIYHSGKKFRVDQLVIQEADQSLSEAKVSIKSGYFLTGEQKNLEICPFSGLNLGDNANKLHLHDLIEMAESRATEVDRISCEEEERVSRGFEIDTYFTVDGSLDCIRRASAMTNGETLLNLRYIPAARLISVNNKWRSTRFDGFPLEMVLGFWRSSMPDPKEAYRLIRLWTSNIADALYIEPIEPLGLDSEGVTTLQHALKRAIESVFQVESNELGVVAVGDPETPNILLYEAAEGSLGILSQFASDIAVFHRVVSKAKEICRYDDTIYKAPASYDDLLSYYNQRDHLSIDRFKIRDALDKLLACTMELQSATNYRNYEEHHQAMLANLDPNSSTERKFIDFLYKNGLRLPDHAQKRVEGIYVQPDFHYEPRIWIFCDGTPHDDPTIQAEDKVKRQEIIARGDEVWVYYYKDDLASKIAARPDIFRKVR